MKFLVMLLILCVYGYVAAQASSAEEQQQQPQEQLAPITNEDCKLINYNYYKTERYASYADFERCAPVKVHLRVSENNCVKADTCPQYIKEQEEESGIASCNLVNVNAGLKGYNSADEIAKCAPKDVKVFKNDKTCLVLKRRKKLTNIYMDKFIGKSLADFDCEFKDGLCLYNSATNLVNCKNAKYELGDSVYLEALMRAFILKDKKNFG